MCGARKRARKICVQTRLIALWALVDDAKSRTHLLLDWGEFCRGFSQRALRDEREKVSFVNSLSPGGFTHREYQVRIEGSSRLREKKEAALSDKALSIRELLSQERSL